MSRDLYYTAPSPEVFEDIKTAATHIWEGYDNTYGYVDEKLDIIRHLQNVGDNWMYMVAMFDDTNQARLMLLVSRETAALIREAMS
jgi:hypothetical protein